MSVQLLPPYAYSFNPYLQSVALEHLSKLGFPDYSKPFSPIGFTALPSDLATQYVTGIPPYAYNPSLVSSLFRTLFHEGRLDYVYPYATTAETVAQAPIDLGAALVKTAGIYLPSLAVLGAAILAEIKFGRQAFNLLGRLPLVGRFISGLTNIPLIGGFVPEILGGALVYSGTSAALGFLADKLLVEPIADVITGVHDVRAATARLMIGEEEFSPYLGTLTPEAAGEVYKELLDIYANAPHLEYSEIMGILTAGSQLGLFDLIGPSKDRLIRAIKSIAGVIDVISEIARDPSIVDSLRNIAQLARLGIPIDMALASYEQLAILSTAAGRPLSSVYPQLLQAGLSYLNYGLSPLTGTLAAAETSLYAKVLAEDMVRRGQGIFLSSLGGPEGIAQRHQQFFATLSQNPLFILSLLNGGPIVGGGVTPERYFAAQLYAPEIMEEMRRKYGPEVTNMLFMYRIANTLQSALPGASRVAIGYVLRQMGFPEDLVRMYVEGGEERLLAALGEKAGRQETARMMEELNRLELRTYGFLGRLQREIIRKGITAPLRRLWANVVTGIEQGLYDWRTRVRLGLEGGIAGWVGRFFWGTPNLQYGVSPNLGFLMAMTTTGEIKEGEVLDILEHADFSGYSGHRRIVAMSLIDMMEERSRKQLEELDLQKLIYSSPLVAKVHEMGLDFRKMTLTEIYKELKRRGIDISRYPIEEREKLRTYIAARLVRENEKYKQLRPDFVPAGLEEDRQALVEAFNWEAAKERLEEGVKRLDYLSVPWHWQTLGMNREEYAASGLMAEISKALEENTLAYLSTGKPKLTEEEVQAVLTVLRDLRERGTLSAEGVKALHYLKERGIVSEESIESLRPIKGFSRKFKENLEFLHSYAKQQETLIKKVQHKAKYGAVIEAFSRGVFELTGLTDVSLPEDLRKRILTEARDVVVSFSKSLQDNVLSPEERSKLVAEVKQFRQQLKAAREIAVQRGDTEAVRKIDRLLRMDDIQLARTLTLGAHTYAKAGAGVENMKDLSDVILEVGDNAAKAASSLKQLSGVLKDIYEIGERKKGGTSLLNRLFGR